MDFLMRVLSANSRSRDIAKFEARNISQALNESLQEELRQMAVKEGTNPRQMAALVDMLFESSFPEDQMFMKTPTRASLESRNESLVLRILEGLDSCGVAVAGHMARFVRRHGVAAISESVLNLMELLVVPLTARKEVGDLTTTVVDDVLAAMEWEWQYSSPLVTSSTPSRSKGVSAAASPLFRATSSISSYAYAPTAGNSSPAPPPPPAAAQALELVNHSSPPSASPSVFRRAISSPPTAASDVDMYIGKQLHRQSTPLIASAATDESSDSSHRPSIHQPQRHEHSATAAEAGSDIDLLQVSSTSTDTSHRSTSSISTSLQHLFSTDRGSAGLQADNGAAAPHTAAPSIPPFIPETSIDRSNNTPSDHEGAPLVLALSTPLMQELERRTISGDEDEGGDTNSVLAAGNIHDQSAFVRDDIINDNISSTMCNNNNNNNVDVNLRQQQPPPELELEAEVRENLCDPATDSDSRDIDYIDMEEADRVDEDEPRSRRRPSDSVVHQLLDESAHSPITCSAASNGQVTTHEAEDSSTDSTCEPSYLQQDGHSDRELEVESHDHNALHAYAGTTSSFNRDNIKPQQQVVGAEMESVTSASRSSYSYDVDYEDDTNYNVNMPSAAAVVDDDMELPTNYNYDTKGRCLPSPSHDSEECSEEPKAPRATPGTCKAPATAADDASSPANCSLHKDVDDSNSCDIRLRFAERLRSMESIIQVNNVSNETPPDPIINPHDHDKRMFDITKLEQLWTTTEGEYGDNMKEESSRSTSRSTTTMHMCGEDESAAAASGMIATKIIPSCLMKPADPIPMATSPLWVAIAAESTMEMNHKILPTTTTTKGGRRRSQKKNNNKGACCFPCFRKPHARD